MRWNFYMFLIDYVWFGVAFAFFSPDTVVPGLVGQLIDSGIFITLAFVGTVATSLLVRIVVAQWLFKTAYEALATPFTYLIVAVVKKREKLDTYDYDTDFNPLKLFSL